MIAEFVGDLVASVAEILWFAVSQGRESEPPGRRAFSEIARRSLRGAYRSWARAHAFEQAPFGYGGTLRNRHVSIRTGVEGEAVFDVRVAIGLSPAERAGAERFTKDSEPKDEEPAALRSLVKVEARSGELRLTLPPMTPPEVTEEVVFAAIDRLTELVTRTPTTPYRDRG